MAPALLPDPALARWWHLYPLGFTGAEPPVAEDRSAPPPEHRLRRVTAWLDHLVDTGLDGLALGPVFAASTHGYDTVDHYRVDPRLGDEADLVELVEQAHARGVRVLLDGVFNHVGDQHPAFRAALAGGPEHPDAELFRIVWPDGGEPTWDCFEGHRSLVTLNHASTRVVGWVADVMTYWLDRGIDGWRLDAAYAVPTEFWVQVVSRVRERHPDAYLVGEVIHGDYPAFVRAAGIDSVTEYELWKATWSAVATRNWHELVWTLGRHQTFADSFRPWTFVGNHDVTRVASQVGDARLVGHTLAVLCTVAGTPAVYYGDELGLVGIKEERAGGDDAVRPALPPTPDQLPRNAEAEQVLATHRVLLGLRRDHPWLAGSTTRVIEVTNDHLLYEQSADGCALLVALNLAEGDWAAPVPGPVRALAVSADGAGAGPGDPDQLRPEDGTVRVPARGWTVLAPTA